MTDTNDLSPSPSSTRMDMYARIAFISFIITTLLFVFIHFIPSLERFILPTSKNIAVLQESNSKFEQKIRAMDAKLEQIAELSKRIEDILQHQSEQDKRLIALEELTQEIQRKVTQVKMTNGSQSTEQIQKIWALTEEKYIKGAEFAEDIQSLIPHLSNNKESIELIHKISLYAKGDVKTLSDLFQDLSSILSINLGVYDEDNSQKWYKRVWRKIKSLVRISREDDPNHTRIDAPTMDLIKTNILEALESLKNKNLKHAMERIQVMAGKVKPAASNWLVEAEKRLKLDTYVSDLRPMILNSVKTR